MRTHHLLQTFTLVGALGVLGCDPIATTKPGPTESDSDAEPERGRGDVAMCREYAPGESGSLDFSPTFTARDLDSIDYEIEYGQDPDAIVKSAVHLAGDETLRITLTGIVDVDQEHPSTPRDFRDVPLRDLGSDSFEVRVGDEVIEPSRVSCSSNPRTPISIVFVVDVTGSMGPVIVAVRDSLLDFVDTARELGLTGKVGVVTYQDTVGVNIPFDECDENVPYERSPFFTPVALDDKQGVERLRDFIGGLHADAGQDFPENLAAALDFAANNVIGTSADGSPNVIGDGKDDPRGTVPWPADELDGLVMFVTITDAPFHGDTSDSDALPKEFKPRSEIDILRSMKGRIVSSIDPAFVDSGTDLGMFSERDADLWPKYTGGFGGDSRKVAISLGKDVKIRESVSYFDLELLVLARGLLEIPLAPVLASTCVIEVPVKDTPASITVALTSTAGNSTFRLTPRRVEIPAAR